MRVLYYLGTYPWALETPKAEGPTPAGIQDALRTSLIDSGQGDPVPIGPWSSSSPP